jgi:hypothetical protein
MVSNPKRVLSKEFFDTIKRIAHPDHLQKHPHLGRFFATFDPRLVVEAFAMHPRFLDFAQKGRRLHFTVDDELGYELVSGQWMESVVRVDLNGGTVRKSIGARYRDFGIRDREIEWLERLQDSGIVPKFISADSEHIVTQYVGEPVSEFSLPDDWPDQAEDILDVLQAYGCTHNDIWVPNIVVADGRLRLIDFAWALPIGTAIPDEWPKELGQYRPDTSTFDDRASLFAALENIADGARAASQEQDLRPPAPSAPPRQ